MNAIEMKKEINRLKNRFKYLNEEMIDVLDLLYEMEEKIMDEEENQWMKIGQVNHVKYV